MAGVRVECDFGGSSYSSLPIGEANGVHQACVAARCDVAGHWTPGLVFCRASRIIFLHTGSNRKRNGGDGTGINFNWSPSVARPTLSIGFAFLES
jgi:hypothetical protein